MAFFLALEQVDFICTVSSRAMSHPFRVRRHRTLSLRFAVFLSEYGYRKRLATMEDPLRHICRTLLRVEIPLVLLSVFLVKLVCQKAYRLFIYPYLFSPLRHLPGPKVSAEMRISTHHNRHFHHDSQSIQMLTPRPASLVQDHHFLIGHTLNQFRSGHPNKPYVSWMRKWPRAPMIRYFDVGNADAVLVTSLEAHKEILHNKAYSFQKPLFFVRLIADIVGYGIGFAEGENHKRQRRGLAGTGVEFHLVR